MNDVIAPNVLAPAGPAAQLISTLTWWMILVFGAVFVIVMLLLFFGIVAKRKDRIPSAPAGDQNFILIGGVFIPALILIGVLIYSLIVTQKLQPPPSLLTIKVKGHMWWWDVEYADSGIRIANELYIPVNRPVRIELTSHDVIHSFWVPNLAGKTDNLPGQENVQWLQASQPGTYRGFCAEYCGVQHTWMGFYVVALPEEKYQEWVQARLQLNTLPEKPELKQGLQVFTEKGCAECHAIRGTPADGRVGPDLTHMGSRLSIGAAKIPNNYGNLSGWISNPQTIKPGNKMPASYLSPDELKSVTSYLMSLK